MAIKNNISKLLLNEFYNLSKSDIEIQINKNIERLVEVENNEKEVTDSKSGDKEIENKMQKFYLSLSNYFSNSKTDSFMNKNSFVPNLKTLKSNI